MSEVKVTEVKQVYLLLNSDSAEKLSEKVNLFLSKGYVLYGFPFRADGFRYQAVILPENNKES